MPGSARAVAGLSVHPSLEVCEAFLRELLVGGRDGAGVLLKCVEEDKEVPGPLIQQAVPGVRESDP